VSLLKKMPAALWGSHTNSDGEAEAASSTCCCPEIPSTLLTCDPNSRSSSTDYSTEGRLRRFLSLPSLDFGDVSARYRFKFGR
jgi:hypothetical protein